MADSRHLAKIMVFTAVAENHGFHDYMIIYCPYLQCVDGSCKINQQSFSWSITVTVSRYGGC